jgi:peptidoglycan/LPS O-acetylase OafA/YrhL
MLDHDARRSDLQILRALSVIAVVVGHVFPYTFKNGYLGVDVFFCLSGFVITPLLLRLQSNRSENRIRCFIIFIKRRINRLVPALYLVLLASTFLIFLFSSIYDLRRIANQILVTFPFLGNFGAYYFSGNYFQPNQNAFVHTWSLGVEFQTYILLALLFCFIKNRMLLRLLLLDLFFTSILIYITNKNNETLFGGYYGTFSRIWEIILGVLIYKLKDSLNEQDKEYYETLMKYKKEIDDLRDTIISSNKTHSAMMGNQNSLILFIKSNKEF